MFGMFFSGRGVHLYIVSFFICSINRVLPQIYFLIAITGCCLQNPREADAMTKIQTDLDETKIILVMRLVCCILQTVACNLLAEMEISNFCQEWIGLLVNTIVTASVLIFVC